MARRGDRTQKGSGSVGLGFIDLLAITLIVVILQMVAIVDSGTEEAPPQPVFYNVNVYQPEHAPGQTSNHFAFVEVGGHLFFWRRRTANPGPPASPLDGLQRDFYDPDAKTWSVEDRWGMTVPNGSVSYRPSGVPDDRRKRIDAFTETVKEKLGVTVSILTPNGRPPRIDLFFDDSVEPFTFEIAHHECFEPRTDAEADGALYDGLVHPVQLSYARLGREPKADDTLYEISRNNEDEWIESRQYSISSRQAVRDWLAGSQASPFTAKCAGKTAKECLASQRETFISITGTFDGDGLTLIDGHGKRHDVR